MDIVTGAFGYTGRHIASLLLSQGKEVKTITTHAGRENPLSKKIPVEPFHFDRPEFLTESLRGADTLYNTYWIRYEHGGLTFEEAVRNTEILFRCAKEAGIRKVVHLSVTNADSNSPYPYFRGKGLTEALLIRSGISHAILRPALIYGHEDILINNIAWMVRRFPVFPIFGAGEYKVQPIFVEDLAALAVAHAHAPENIMVDAIGPETMTFLEMVKLICSKLQRHPLLARVPNRIGGMLGSLVGWIVRDTVLTPDEISALASNLLFSIQPPNAETKLSQWLEENQTTAGQVYRSELKRHFRG